MSLSESKANSMIGNLTGTARKVYDATPIQEAWTAQEVKGETDRRGSSIAFNVVSGCLKSLLEQGLVQFRDGGYRRTPVRTVRPTMPTIEEVQEEVMAQVAQPQIATLTTTKLDPVQRLAGLSQRLRALADDIDAAAVEVDDHIKKLGQDSIKLKQLQALLKGIGE